MKTQVGALALHHQFLIDRHSDFHSQRGLIYTCRLISECIVQCKRRLEYRSLSVQFFVCFFFNNWLVMSRIFGKNILTVSISVSKRLSRNSLTLDEGYQEIALHFDRNIFIWYGNQPNSSEGLSSAGFSLSSCSFLRNSEEISCKLVLLVHFPLKLSKKTVEINQATPSLVLHSYQTCTIRKCGAFILKHPFHCSYVEQ